MSYVVRFLILIILILASLGIIRLGLKNYGLRQPVSNFKTPLVQRLSDRDRPLIWNQWGDITTSSNLVNLEISYLDSVWMITNTKNPYALADFKINNQDTVILLWPKINGPTLIPSLRELLKNNDLWKQTLFCSRSDGVLKDLRELEPQWSFCNGEIFLTKMLSLESVGLESLLKIKSDVFYIHLDNLPLQNKIKTLITEARRQGRLIIMGPVSKPTQDYDVDGWLIKSPSKSF